MHAMDATEASTIQKRQRSICDFVGDWNAKRLWLARTRAS